MKSYEKLGAFYLGGVVGEDGEPDVRQPLLYDMNDLCTHAVCVGMTGSGKTGLAAVLLEEAALDGVPVIAIDPKGDLGNLLLAFPELRAEDFEPWMQPGLDPSARAREAQATADLWRKGLAQWDQEPERVGRYAVAAERALYTPGSRAGRPLALLRSFDAPRGELDEEALRDRIAGAAAGVLGLLGLDADPLRSREHILLANLLDRAWREGRNLDLAELIRQVQKPDFERVGVLDLESFFPASERGALALSLNNLIAAPGFAAWLEGEPLDVERLLYTPDGRARLSVISIAHLSDGERMFAVTLLLSEILAWVRRQPGSRTLRALLYMDEIFGYFPPTANPPSKLPMLTLLKQARAFGLGVVLATQNPVDLDYKGLANTGTWFLGRLQTERDKARVLDGLESASGKGLDRARVDALLSNLPKRTFLMQNVHEDAPVLFQTRWSLSYLAGPLSREQLRRLAASDFAAAAVVPAPAGPAPEPSAAPLGERPPVPADIPEVFGRAATGAAAVYRPALLARAALRYADAKLGVDTWQRIALLAPLPEALDGDPWQAIRELEVVPQLQREPAAGASFAPLPAAAANAKSFPLWSKELATWLARERPLRLWRSAAPRLASKPGESEGAFRARVRDALRESRQVELEALRRKHAPKLERLQDQIRRAEHSVERQEAQYRHEKLSTAISLGTSVIGALFGRKLGRVGGIASAARGASRAAREREDVGRAEERTEVLRQRLAALDAQFEADAAALREIPGPEAIELEEVRIAPRKGDLAVEELVLAWLPEVAGASARAHAAAIC